MSSPYQHRRFARWQILSFSLKFIGTALNTAPILIFVALWLSPVSPYLRWQSQPVVLGSLRIDSSCRYLGVRGFIQYRQGIRCPLFVMIDHRELDTH